MRLLIDEALQDAVAHRLAEKGHDTSHVRDLGLAGSTDEDVMAHAVAEDRVLVTTDTDFGTILALTGAAGPSVLLLRGIGDATQTASPPSSACCLESRTSSPKEPSWSSKRTATASATCPSKNLDVLRP